MSASGDVAEQPLLIYFERQQAALCGVHCLNSLLQGPYLSEVELAQIAQELDAAEHELLHDARSGGAAALGEWGNVAEDGMFSSQVLLRALDAWGLAAVPLDSPEAAAAKAEPQHEQAFICNLREHWFTVRQLYRQWWNLNSTASAPEPLSAFYLAAWLSSVQEQGYTIWVIRGQLPAEPHPDSVLREGGPGHWMTAAEAETQHKAAQGLKQQGFLQAAYRGLMGKAGTTMQLRPRGPITAGTAGDDEDDPGLAAALAASLADAGSLQAGPSHGQKRTHSAGGGGWEEAEAFEDEDPELATALAASMEACTPSSAPAEQQAQQAPEQPRLATDPAFPELGNEPPVGAPGALELGLRLPNGQRATRRFEAGQTVGHLAAFAAQQGADMSRHHLARQFPRQASAVAGRAGRRAPGVPA